MLLEAALGALGFARKAGQCITGADKVNNMIRTGHALAVLHATDGSGDGLRKLKQAVHAAGLEGRQVQVWRIFSNAQMNMALGASNVIHAALNTGGAARNCASRVAELANYREMEPS